MRTTGSLTLVALVVALLAPLPARAVILCSGDGTGNTSPPEDDFGWDHVAKIGSLSAVYLGGGWVLTANHVGLGDVDIAGDTYPPVVDSWVRLEHPEWGEADLAVFRIQGDPGLPRLPITSAPYRPEAGTEVILVGNGRNRGDAVYVDPADPETLVGWHWGTGRTLRWGTNRLDTFGVVAAGTWCFSTRFQDLDHPDSSPHEAQAALGDSGGAVLASIEGTWQLLGVVIGVSRSGMAIFGDQTFAVDLTAYREQIREVTGLSDCKDGVDNDGDGLVDRNDIGCSSVDDPSDLSEQSNVFACDDGIDNDGDLLVDFPHDPGCVAPSTLTESPACDDELDNDGDGTRDWDGGMNQMEPDPDCTVPWQDFGERAESGCGGVYAAGLLALPVLWIGRRLRRRS